MATANNTFNPGDLVWAKLKGYPAWPAMVLSPFDVSIACPSGKLPVLFFGTNETGFLKPPSLFPYLEFRERLEKPRAKGAKSFKLFNLGLIQIRKEAGIWEREDLPAIPTGDTTPTKFANAKLNTGPGMEAASSKMDNCHRNAKDLPVKSKMKPKSLAKLRISLKSQRQVKGKITELKGKDSLNMIKRSNRPLKYKKRIKINPASTDLDQRQESKFVELETINVKNLQRNEIDNNTRLECVDKEAEDLAVVVEDIVLEPEANTAEAKFFHENPVMGNEMPEMKVCEDEYNLTPSKKRGRPKKRPSTEPEEERMTTPTRNYLQYEMEIKRELKDPNENPFNSESFAAIGGPPPEFVSSGEPAFDTHSISVLSTSNISGESRASSIAHIKSPHCDCVPAPDFGSQTTVSSSIHTKPGPSGLKNNYMKNAFVPVWINCRGCKGVVLTPSNATLPLLLERGREHVLTYHQRELPPGAESAPKEYILKFLPELQRSKIKDNLPPVEGSFLLHNMTENTCGKCGERELMNMADKLDGDCEMLNHAMTHVQQGNELTSELFYECFPIAAPQLTGDPFRRDNLNWTDKVIQILQSVDGKSLEINKLRTSLLETVPHTAVENVLNEQKFIEGLKSLSNLIVEEHQVKLIA